MQKIINFILGSVLIEVCGSYPERFLNLCARYGIEFWDMENVELGVLRMRMKISSFKKLRIVAKKSMCKVHIREKTGLPFFVHRFRKRGVLVVGCVIFCVIAWAFTSFVWVIDINGFSGLDTVKLRKVLSDSGLRIGTYASSVRVSELRNNVLIEMPELSYLSVNFCGSYAEVTAKKRTAPPQILPEDVPCDIIAKSDGIIHDMTVKTGTPEVARGETVTKGQLLVSGYMTGRAGTTIITHADAVIQARTWRKFDAKILKKKSKKVYTGNEKQVSTIIFFGNRIKLSLNSGISYAKCDKIIETTDFELPGGLRLPLSLERASYVEYEITENVMSDDAAYAILNDGLHNSLEIPDGAELVKADIKSSSDATFAYASITAECLEEIGEKREVLRNG